MRRTVRKRTVGAILALALVVAACGSGDGAGDGEPITVASFGFNESVIVAEMYAQALEANGYEVERKLNLGNREVVKPALESGEIDLVPEYIGTLAGFLGAEESADPEQTWNNAKEAFEPKGVTLLRYSPAQDSNAYVVTAETASALGLSKVSDLEAHAPDLIFGGPPECPERDLCLKGLIEVYGLNFAEFKPLDAAGAITIAALDGGEIDVALLFSTQGIIAQKGWVALEDDKGLNPAENLVPAIRTDVLDAYGDDLKDLLERVAAALTTADLTELNKRADLDQEDPAALATEWLTDNGFLDS
ncbi:MAG: ABC transporter substrate-binding protein [Acidimicrobiia bacterium]|nr:ABC transporter substrate-binding protein [Acidimicrobiia bacterium]